MNKEFTFEVPVDAKWGGFFKPGVWATTVKQLFETHITSGSIFKPKRTDPKTGKKAAYQCWYIKYTGADGIVRKVKGFKNKVVTQQRAAELELRAEMGQVGMVDALDARRKAPLACEACRSTL